MPTPRLDERALRLPDWQGGFPIRLMDDQEWLLAPVAFDWEGVNGEDGQPTMVKIPDPGAELAKELVEAFQTGTGPAEWSLPRYYAVGKRLLQRNYRLTDEEVAGLLPLMPGTEGYHEAAVAEGYKGASRLGDMLSTLVSHIGRTAQKLTPRGETFARALWHHPDAMAEVDEAWEEMQAE